MVASNQSCDRGELRLLLDGRLPAPRESLVTQHLEQCATCRNQLETLAANESWWRQASDYLRNPLAEDSSFTVSPPEAIHEPELLSSSLTWVGLEPSDDPLSLGRLGRYEVLEAIGQGGMGVVLKACDRELNRFVAIKVLLPHLATSAAARRRFVREAQAAAAVVHPHVVAIHAVDAKAPLPYLVMQYVAGETLQRRLDTRGPLEVRDVLRIGMQAARGLAAAHAQGLVHRDVKPANILLERDVDRALVTDFGLARAVDDASLTRSGVIAGTPQYMAPEQARGESVDARSDLFSLGSVLYAMCAGYPPFRAESPLAAIQRIIEGPPRPLRQIQPDVPQWLERIIARLHAMDPAERFESADAVADLLEQCLAHVQRPDAHRLPGGLIETREEPKPGAHGVAAMAVTVALLISLLVWSGMMGPRGKESSENTAPASGSPVESTPRGAAQRSQHSASQGTNLSEAAAISASIEDELQAIDRSLKRLEQSFLSESVY